MAESFATVAEFLLRFDALFVAQLTSIDDLAANESRVGLALDDATAEISGFLPRIPAARRPDAATRRVHCIKIAAYLLAQGRPGGEFESIRNGYTDTIKYYRDLVDSVESKDASPPIEGSACAPPPVFGCSRAWKGFGDG